MADEEAAPGAVLEGRFEGRRQFQQIVREALVLAASEGWQEIIFCDPSFEDWPLGERSVAESLQAWSKAGRKFTLLAMRYDEVLRRHHRFVSWRRTWAHIIDCRACAAADASEFPSMIWSPGWVMDRRDPVRSVGVTGREPERRIAQNERLAEWLTKSSPAFAASTLGL